MFLAGLLLIVSMACGNLANTQGTNPNNSAVQAGDANNLYKRGRDKCTNQKMFKSGQDQASL